MCTNHVIQTYKGVYRKYIGRYKLPNGLVVRAAVRCCSPDPIDKNEAYLGRGHIRQRPCTLYFNMFANASKP